MVVFSTARHGDGLYDSYMRTDHVVNQDADVKGQSPSGLPPLPKYTVRSDFLFPQWCPFWGHPSSVSWRNYFSSA